MDREAVSALTEDASLRTSNQRHYRRPDGLMQAIVGHHLNYRSGGKWKRREDHALAMSRTAKSLIEVRNDSDELPVRIVGNRVHVGDEWFEVEGLYLDDALLESPGKVTPTIDGETVTFAGVFPDIDIDYLVTPHRVKETIHIRRNPMVGRFVSGERLSVRFHASRRQAFEAVSARDRIRPVPVVESWKGTYYTIGVSTTDLRSVSYPLAIDPTIVNGVSHNVCADGASLVGTTDPYYRVGDTYSDDGKGDISNSFDRTLFRFSLAGISGITNALCYLYQEWSSAGSAVYLHRATTPTDPATATAAQVWSNALGTSITSWSSASGLAAWASAQGVTTYAQACAGSAIDFGLTGDETGGYGSDVGFAAENFGTTTLRPYLSVTYGAATTPITGVASIETGAASATVRQVLAITAGAGDGYVACGSATTWANAVAGTGTLSSSATGPTTRASAALNTTYTNNRSFFPFPLTGVSGAVTAATLVVVQAVASSETCLLHLYAGNEASPSTLATTDYGLYGTTELAPSVVTPGALGGIALFTLNAAGLAYLNSVGTGTAQFCIRNDHDVTGTAPTANFNNYLGTSENTTVAYRPVLTVTFGGPSAVSLGTVSAAESASVTAAVRTLVPMIVASGASGAVAAAVAVLVRFAAASIAAAPAAASMHTLAPFAAASQATSTEAVTVNSLVKLGSEVSAAVGGATVALQQLVPMVAASSGQAAANAVVNSLVSVIASAKGVSTSTAALGLLVTLAATSQGTAGVTAIANALAPFVASAQGTSVETATVILASALITASSTSAGPASAAVNVLVPMVAASLGHATDQVSVNDLVLMAAQAVGLDTTGATVDVLVPLVAVSGAVGAAAAALYTLQTMSAASIAAGAAGALVNALVPFVASAQGVSEADASARLLVLLQACADVRAEVDATVTTSHFVDIGVVLAAAFGSAESAIGQFQLLSPVSVADATTAAIVSTLGRPRYGVHTSRPRIASSTHTSTPRIDSSRHTSTPRLRRMP